MSATQSESLHILKAYGRAAKVDEQVWSCLHSQGKAIRDVICERTGLLVSTVCGALDRLKKRGAVEEVGTAFNETTRRNVTVYQAKEADYA